MQNCEKEIKELKENEKELDKNRQIDVPPVLEEIVIEELAVDGICGIY
ncbi:Putative electron carrier mycofactocin, MtfA-like [Desulfonema limicola]|uniref:Electron carrier mycofactocin, MtfA-like n=1 Tax=Desulfonema limicola TaxID=45656 RepID=A0A975B9T7_9BACT|nr:variant-type mycofactocin precursor [Desulfonema limicola]QTA81413.1 Putative electron carrier mycofactocin, MtfA-like [Desulfonema limicola]